MIVLALDEEWPQLERTKSAVKDALPFAEVYGFLNIDEIMPFLRILKREGRDLSYVFLRIGPGNTKGLKLVEDIRGLFSCVRLIVVSTTWDCAQAAFGAYAIGYMLTPVTDKKIIDLLEIENLPRNEKSVVVHTFGNFEVFVSDNPVTFKSRKAKELLAYLVDRRGAGVTTEEIASRLWEDKPYDTALKDKVQRVRCDLRQSLKAAGISDIIIWRRNDLAVKVNALDCDYYRVCAGDRRALAAFMGEYMSNYSWAEETEAALCRLAESEKIL